MTAAGTVVATRQDLEQIDDQAWALYGDIASLSDSKPEERRQAFDAAMASLRMLLDHDRALLAAN